MHNTILQAKLTNHRIQKPTNTQTNIYSNQQISKLTTSKTDRQTHRSINMHIFRILTQTNKHKTTNKQIDKHTNQQAHRTINTRNKHVPYC